MKTIPTLILMLMMIGSIVSDRAREANQAYESGDFEKAEALYRDLLEDRPDNPAVLFNLGNTLARQGRSRDAAELFERYREVVSDPAEKAPAEYNLGYLNGMAGNTDEALQRFRSALKLDPTDEDAKYNYELLRRRQQETPPDQEEDDDQQQDQEPQTGGQSPPFTDDDSQRGDETGQESAQPDQDQQPSSDDQQPLTPDEITSEQLDHAEDIMNALEQIEKDLIKNFKKQQHDPVEVHEKDW